MESDVSTCCVPKYNVSTGKLAAIAEVCEYSLSNSDTGDNTE